MVIKDQGEIVDSQTITTLLSNAGLTTGGGSFNWANVISGLIFGTIGFIAFMYGKKEKSVKPLVIGLVLMVYPYFVSNTFAQYAIGISLTAALYFWRD